VEDSGDRAQWEDNYPLLTHDTDADTEDRALLSQEDRGLLSRAQG
jgi:hypothetical protein